MSVVTKAPPANLEIDGDLKEWGSLDAEPAQAAAEPEQVMPYGMAPAAAELPEPSTAVNPAVSGSHLAVALGEALTIAGELGAAAADGAWVAIGSSVPLLPPTGIWYRAQQVAGIDCVHEQDCCNDGEIIQGPERPPEVRAACEATIARNKEYIVEHAAEFERIYRLDATGAKLLEPDGKLTAIAAAKVALVKSDTGAHLEATLPLEALPRFSQAPIQTLRFQGRPLSKEPPKSATANDGWIWLNLPQPVSFEPNAAVREIAFANLPSIFFNPAMSYSATDRDHIFYVRHSDDASTLVPHNEVIYEKLNTLGDVEVGLLNVPTKRLLIRKAGQLVAILNHTEGGFMDLAPDPEIKFAKERGGDLHYVFFNPGFVDSWAGMPYFGWWAAIVHADGTYEANALDLTDMPMAYQYYKAKVSSNADFTKLTLGMPDYMRDVYADLTWTWDAKKKKWNAKRKDKPIPKELKLN
ncbi:MAG: hypothetical protein U0271_43485 [Polyangiaceae bacterium]